MIDPDKIALYIETSAVEAYGEDQQMIVAIEELAELQKEITKMLRGTGDPEHLAEETADVLIMIDQLMIIFGNTEKVKGWKAKKLVRLQSRISGREEE